MQPIDSILAVADQYDAIVFDQWGVLHNGTAPYPEAVATVAALRGRSLAVLSNSGKSADVNRARITDMGFAPDAFGVVMTSGQALFDDLQGGRLKTIKTLYPITAKPGDAQVWAKGLDVQMASNLADSDAVLLMGLPDAAAHPAEHATLDKARALGLRLICSNPDRHSPRAGGIAVQSPGTLAHAYADAGGDVAFYGKPHRPIFDAVLAALGAPDPAGVLMVGDSPEHDIAGAQGAGWDSLFIAGGLHADATSNLFTSNLRPTYTLPTLR